MELSSHVTKSYFPVCHSLVCIQGSDLCSAVLHFNENSCTPCLSVGKMAEKRQKYVPVLLLFHGSLLFFPLNDFWFILDFFLTDHTEIVVLVLFCLRLQQHWISDKWNLMGQIKKKILQCPITVLFQLCLFNLRRFWEDAKSLFNWKVWAWSLLFLLKASQAVGDWGVSN